MYAANLREALRDDPQQEHLILTLFDGPSGRLIPDINLGTPDGSLRRFVDPRAILALRRAVKRVGAGLVVAHGGEALKYAVVAGGAVLIYKRTGLSTREVSRFGRARLYRLLSRRAHFVVGVSRELLDQTHALYGVPRSRLIYIPNSRDPDVYRPLSKGEDRPSEGMVLFVGQFEQGKRPSLFLDVVQSLRADGYEFRAMMVGDGKMKAALERRASELDVALVGVRNDVPELMRAATVLVMTSAQDTEGMPGVLIEAAMSGIPVVATLAAGVTDVVEHGKTGWISEVDDPDVLAEYVGQLLDDPEFRRRQSVAARKRGVDLFSIQTTAAQWRKLVSQIRSLYAKKEPRASGIVEGGL